MKHRHILSALAASLAFAAPAASTVSDVVARQRWPWSETIDIDFTVTGDKCDVDFTATWDGQTDPVPLGTAFQASAGQHRFEWCPTNNHADQTLTGFTVAAKAASFEDHLYLILDLQNGGYSYTNAVPEGGWTSEHKSTKMVFRRCPAGTYSNGIDADLLQKVAGGAGGADYSSAYATAAGEHTATFTSDWYMSVYPLTVAQYEQVRNGSATDDYTGKGITYNALRGATNDSPCINWPVSQYTVSDDSFVRKLRDKANGELCIDLPQEDQWEAAARAGATTIWPNGGTQDDTLEQCTNYVNQIVNWYYSMGGTATEYQAIGLMQTNSWGISDIVGNRSATWCLDTAKRTGNRAYPSNAAPGGTDPVGVTATNYAVSIRRIVHGVGTRGPNTRLFQLVPSTRFLYDTDANSVAARFVIHLEPLGF